LIFFSLGIYIDRQRFERLLANNESTSWLFATESAIARTGYNRASRAFVAYYSFTVDFFITVVFTQMPTLSAEDGSSTGLILAYFANVFFGLLITTIVGLPYLRDMLASRPELNSWSPRVEAAVGKVDDLYHNYQPPTTSYRFFVDYLMSIGQEAGEGKKKWPIPVTVTVFASLSGGMWFVVYYLMSIDFSPITLAYEIAVSLVLYILQQLMTNYYQNEIVIRHSFTSLYNQSCEGCNLVDETRPRDEIRRPTLVAIMMHDAEDALKSYRKLYRSELQWNSDKLDNIDSVWTKEKSIRSVPKTGKQHEDDSNKGIMPLNASTSFARSSGLSWGLDTLLPSPRQSITTPISMAEKSESSIEDTLEVL